MQAAEIMKELMDNGPLQGKFVLFIMNVKSLSVLGIN